MNARDYAWRQLAAARLPGWQFDAASFRPKQADPPEDPRDLDLAHAITLSVTKHLDHLRHLIHHYSGRTPQQIDPTVQIILSMGLAQLRFFDRLPPYAVVDEAVNQAKRLGFGKAAGFVNAVLRRALREPAPPLPDKVDAQEYARAVLSHPPVLFQRMVKLLGVDDALELAARHNAEAPLIVRGTPDAPEGVTVTPHEVSGFSVISGAGEAVLSDWAKTGVAQPQDPTSAAVVDKMQLSSAKLILDRCCGVGTKTLQIASAAPQAQVVAIDPARFSHRSTRPLPRGARLEKCSNDRRQRHPRRATDVRPHSGRCSLFQQRRADPPPGSAISAGRWLARVTRKAATDDPRRNLGISVAGWPDDLQHLQHLASGKR